LNISRTGAEADMQFEDFAFGSIRIDGVSREYDVVIDRGEIRKRKKKLSKQFRDAYGHTPLTTEEEIPWKCRRLVIGTGGVWETADHGRAKTRGAAPQDRIGHSADRRRYRSAQKES
jgi:hypothetical protein